MFQPETAHNIAKNSLQVLSRMHLLTPIFGNKVANNPCLKRQLMGMTFKNPIGIAAGFDKNAEFIKPLQDIGFGFVEVGTITPLPQMGNPKPRCFRLKKDEAIINRMGFNSWGVEEVVKRLMNRPQEGIVGANIGKNTTTSDEDAHKDYLFLLQRLYPYADYFVINVSCPNIANSTTLQDTKNLDLILRTCVNYRHQQQIAKPILLKISPDLSSNHLVEIVNLVKQHQINGIIAGNTTTDRKQLSTDNATLSRIGKGGLSGRPLLKKTVTIVRQLKELSNGDFIIIGVGGVITSKHAEQLFSAGADLIQIYTGFIYKGSCLIHRICKKLLSEIYQLRI